MADSLMDSCLVFLITILDSSRSIGEKMWNFIMDFPKRIQQMFSKKSDAKENVAKENFANEVEICYLWNFFIRPCMITKKRTNRKRSKGLEYDLCMELLFVNHNVIWNHMWNKDLNHLNNFVAWLLQFFICFSEKIGIIREKLLYIEKM